MERMNQFQKVATNLQQNVQMLSVMSVTQIICKYDNSYLLIESTCHNQTISRQKIHSFVVKVTNKLEKKC